MQSGEMNWFSQREANETIGIDRRRWNFSGVCVGSWAGSTTPAQEKSTELYYKIIDTYYPDTSPVYELID